MSRRQTRTKNNTTDAHLQEQVTLLTTENERLKAILAQHGLENVLNARIPNEENVPKKSRGLASVQNSTVGQTTPITPRTAGKGCSCRGNCATRVCGCVKKNVPCAEFCRCGDVLCQNQEPNKENIEEPNLEKASDSSARIKASSRIKKSASDKRVERAAGPRSIFSPAGSSDANLNRENMRFEDGELRFGDDSESCASDKSDETISNRPRRTNEETASSMKKTMKTTRDEENQGRSRRRNVKLPEVAKKLRSLSSRENETKSSDGAEKTSDRRSMSLDGEAASSNRPDKPGKKLASLINGPRSLGRAAKIAKTGKKPRTSGNKGVSSDNENRASRRKIEKKKKNDVKATTRAMMKKNAGASNDGAKRSKNLNSMNEKNDAPSEREADEASSSAAKEASETAQMARKRENHETNSVTMENKSANDDSASESIGQTEISVKPEPEVYDLSDNMEQAAENNSAETSRDSGNSEPSTASRIGDVASGYSTIYPEENDDFDPMKPRHKLSRSPMNSRNESSRYYHPLDLSERPLPLPLEEPVIDIPPPEELMEPVVDWEKHKAKLVQCRKCGRCFYPYRLNKHEASCLNV